MNAVRACTHEQTTWRHLQRVPPPSRASAPPCATEFRPRCTVPAMRRSGVLGVLVSNRRVLAATVPTALLLLGCSNAAAQTVSVETTAPQPNGVSIVVAEAECNDLISVQLQEGKHRATLHLRVGGDEEFAPGPFRPLIQLEGGFCVQGETEPNEPAQLKITGTTVYPSESVAFRFSVNGTAIGSGRVILTRHGQPPHRIWQGEDAFVNYCIDDLKRITSIGGRLGCYEPGSYQDHARVVWNH